MSANFCTRGLQACLGFELLNVGIELVTHALRNPERNTYGRLCSLGTAGSLLCGLRHEQYPFQIRQRRETNMGVKLLGQTQECIPFA